MAFFVLVAALATLSVVVAHPVPAPCPAPVVEPCAPHKVGPKPPIKVEHHATPYEINYFQKPWIIKTKHSAAFNVYTQTPVVIDEYGTPEVTETPGPPAVIIEEVCPHGATQVAPVAAVESVAQVVAATPVASTYTASTYSTPTYSPSTYSASTYSSSNYSPSTNSISKYSPSTYSPSTYSKSTYSKTTY